MEAATFADADVEAARAWARVYDARGLAVLPSSTEEKRPLVRYREWLHGVERPPLSLFDEFPTPNLQAICGVARRLLVVDLDGPEAQDRWAGMGRCPRTWETHSGGDGRHVWFTLPPGFRRPMRKAVLWKGEGKHSQIDRLCDGSLVMLPPSIHPETGRKYRFVADRSPFEVPCPAAVPSWVLGLKPVDSPDRERRPAPGWLGRLPGKVERARSWGLEVMRRNPSGWWPCRAFDRDDRTPSAAIHEDSGYYVDLGSGQRLTFVQLAVAMRAYPDERAALDALRREVAV